MIPIILMMIIITIIISLDGLAATTYLFNRLHRRSYPLGAGCAYSRLIWALVRRFRSVVERIYVPTFCQQVWNARIQPHTWKRKIGNGRFHPHSCLETTLSNPKIGHGKLETENAHVCLGREGVPHISAFHTARGVGSDLGVRIGGLRPWRS